MTLPAAYGQGQKPEFIDAVSRGEVPGWKFERKFAFADVGTTEQPIWEGGVTYEFVDSPEDVAIVSDSIADTIAGTGAQKVRVIGLNAGVITSEVVNLNGTTPVTLANQYDFIHRCFVAQAGATSPVIPAIANSEGAAGTITLTGATSSAVRAVIVGNKGGSLQGLIRVPVNEEWLIHDVTVTAGKGQELSIKSYIRVPGTQIWVTIAEGQLIQDGILIPAHRVLTAGTDLIFTGKTSAGTVQASILIQITRKNATEDLV